MRLIKRNWTGKVDGEDPSFRRWHQQVEFIDLRSQFRPAHGSTILVGFACDEGVHRNSGRTGARKGPIHIRKAMSNMAIDSGHFVLYDAGDIECIEGQLEDAQSELSKVVKTIHEMGCKSMILGGGHELAYPHFMGLHGHYVDKKIGIINFDAHFDMRVPENEIGPTSGTGFMQIAREIDDFNYFVLGIQDFGNTRSLFNSADKFSVKYIPANQFRPEFKDQIISQIEGFIDKCDLIYLTICMDVFSSAFAPGVSASNFNGLMPNYLVDDLLNVIINKNKLVGVDIAEVNPELDIDERTSKLAAYFLYRILNAGGSNPLQQG